MRTLALFLALITPAIVGATGPAGAAPASTGDVVTVAPLAPAVTLPGSVNAQRVTYQSTTVADKPAISSGAIYFPPGQAPAGGWPVVAWAHGTIGLADQCAYSIGGPGAKERDWAYLGAWLKQGYAVVAADYAGLGTPGNHPYLNGVVAAHNVVDSVRAAHRKYPGVISNRWVVIGQSQGGGAAMFTARYATQFGGRELDYRGAVATGLPGHVEDVMRLLGPGVPPVRLGPATTAYSLYLLSGLRTTYPELDISSYLTPAGRHWVDRSETLCLGPLEDEIRARGVVGGDLFTKPLAALPNSAQLFKNYMGVPESGYDRPIFIGQGIADTDIILPGTVATIAALQANNQPVTVRYYPADHSGTVNASLPDSVPFVQRLLK